MCSALTVSVSLTSILVTFVSLDVPMTINTFLIKGCNTGLCGRVRFILRILHQKTLMAASITLKCMKHI